MKTLHIYAQELWHNPAYIVGNEEGLRALRDALNALIEEAAITDATAAAVFCTDGEGYTCFCIHREELDDVQMPYADPLGIDRNKTVPPQKVPRVSLKEIDKSVWNS